MLPFPAGQFGRECEGGDKGLVGSQRPGKTARPRAGYRPPQLHPPRGHLLLRKRLSPAFLKKGASLVPGFPLRPLAGAPGVAAPHPAAIPALAAAGMKAGGSSPCLSPPVGSGAEGFAASAQLP